MEILTDPSEAPEEDLGRSEDDSDAKELADLSLPVRSPRFVPFSTSPSLRFSGSIMMGI